jgi:AraC-like DNA-binding protein
MSVCIASSLVAVNVYPEHRAHVARAIWPIAHITFVDYWNIDRHLRAPDDDDVTYLVSLNPSARSEIEDVIREIRHARPITPIIAYATIADDWASQAVRAIQAGANHLAMREFDDLQRVMMQVSLDAQLVPACADTLKLVLPWIPEAAHTVVGLCTMRAPRTLSVDDVANTIGTSKRSLHRQLRSLGLPTPESTISWCRLFVAIYLIALKREPVDHVAGALNFRSGAGLRNMLRRYTGCTPTATRDPDAVSRLARWYSEAGRRSA